MSSNLKMNNEAMMILDKRIGPYRATYSDEMITTCVLYDARGNRYAWHELKNRKLDFPEGSQITGIVINSKNQIDYRRSRPKLVDLFSTMRP